MVGWHHQLNGHKFEQTPGEGEGQGRLVCCSPWGPKSWTQLSDSTTTTMCLYSSFFRTAEILPKTSSFFLEVFHVPELSDVGQSDWTEALVAASMASPWICPSADSTRLTLPGSGGFTIRGHVLRKEVQALRTGRQLTGFANSSPIRNTFSCWFIVSGSGTFLLSSP